MKIATKIATKNSHSRNSHEIDTKMKIDTFCADAWAQMSTAKKIATKIDTPAIFLATLIWCDTSEKKDVYFW